MTQLRPPNNLPYLQAQWARQVRDLQDNLEASHKQAVQSTKGPARESQSKAQTNAAAVKELHAAKAYNDFLDTDRHYNRLGNDADRALRSGRPLSRFDRNALEASRDQSWATAGEFQTFKSANQLRPAHVPPINVAGKTHYVDGRQEWNGSVPGLLGSGIEKSQAMAKAFTEAVKAGPLTTEENVHLCNGLLGVVVSAGSRKLPGLTQDPIGRGAFGKARSEAMDATDPAATTCRLIYPSSRSLEDLRRYGSIDAVDDPQLGRLNVLRLDPRLTDLMLPGGLDRLGDIQAPVPHTSATATATSTPSPAQQEQMVAFHDQLGVQLSRHGMSSEQINTLAAAAVAHNAQHADKGAPGRYFLGKTGDSIAVVYPPDQLTEMDVAQSLSRPASEHLASPSPNTCGQFGARDTPATPDTVYQTQVEAYQMPPQAPPVLVRA